jgi:hypothetical protein
LNTNNPIGTDKRIISSTFTFTVPVQISIPAVVKKEIVEKIFLRIGAVGQATSNSDIIAELDQEGVLYQMVADASGINI